MINITYIVVEIRNTVNMAISKYLKCLSISSIVIGCLLLVLTLISVIGGGLVVKNVIDPPDYARIGVWGLYVSTQGL